MAVGLIAACSTGDLGPAAPVITAEEPAEHPAPDTGAVVSNGSVVTIDVADERQTMDGFGASTRVWSDVHMSGQADAVIPAEAQAEILQRLYGDLGLTRQRSVIDRGIEPVNDNDDPTVVNEAAFDFTGMLLDEHIALVEAAQPFGLSTFFAAPVNLEEWMEPTETAEYVEWAMVLLRHWRDAGAEPPFFSPVNEPALRAARSAPWLRDVVRELGRQLRAEGFETQLVIPDDLNATEAYARAELVLEDPEARQYVGALAFHLYGGSGSDEARLADLARTYDLPLWMTEASPGEMDSWAGALAWATTVQRLITELDVSAVDSMWGFFGSRDVNALIGLEFVNGRYSGFDLRPIADAVGQFSRFVRPGATRVGATWGGDGSASAFTGPDGELVVVLINPSHSVTQVRVEVVNGEVGTSVSATTSSADAGNAPQPTTAATPTGFSIELGAQSVTTVVVAERG